MIIRILLLIVCTHKKEKSLCFHFEDLKRDIGLNKYSLFHDETNDISIYKILRVSMIYYSDNCGKVV